MWERLSLRSHQGVCDLFVQGVICIIQFVKHLLDEFVVFIRHCQALTILKSFSVGNVLDYAMMLANDARDRVDVCSKELFSRICLVYLLFEELTMQRIL